MTDPITDPEILQQRETHWRRRGWTRQQITAAEDLVLGRPTTRVARDPAVVELARLMSDHLAAVRAADDA